MNKYQEAKFKDYVWTIEFLIGKIDEAWELWNENKPSKEIVEYERQLIKTRKEFFEWFKNTIDKKYVKKLPCKNKF
jgi:hypothetical protein